VRNHTQRPLLPTITGENRLLYQSPCQATGTGRNQREPEKKNQCGIQESLIISVSEGDEKMRWRKKIEQREKHAYEETRNCAKGGKKKRKHGR
jgi:hypothetical protein